MKASETPSTAPPTYALNDPVLPRIWNRIDTICGVRQGTGATNRVGRKLTIKAIQGHLQFQFYQRAADENGGARTTPNFRIKMMLIQDMQANGTAPVKQDLFEPIIGPQAEDQPGVRALQEDIQFMSIENSQRYKVLKTMTKVLNKGFSATELDGVYPGSNWCTVNCEFYKKCNIDIEYQGQAGEGNNMDVSIIRSNNVFFVVCVEGLRYADGPNFTNINNYFPYGIFRIRFQDS